MSEIGERKKKYIDSLSSCTLCVLLQTYVCLVNLLFVFNVKWVTWRLNVFVLLCCDERSRQLGLKFNSHALVLMMLRHILSVWYNFKFNPKLYVLSGLWHFSQIQFLLSERGKKSRVAAMKQNLWFSIGFALVLWLLQRLDDYTILFSPCCSLRKIFFFINRKTSSTGDLEMRFRM